MAHDNDFVIETVFSFNEIVQVHVSVFVDQLFAMIGRNKSHLRNQDFTIIEQRIVIQSWRRRVTRESDQRNSAFFCYFCPGNSKVANLVSRHADEFLFQFFFAAQK